MSPANVIQRCVRQEPKQHGICWSSLARIHCIPGLVLRECAKILDGSFDELVELGNRILRDLVGYERGFFVLRWVLVRLLLPPSFTAKPS